MLRIQTFPSLPSVSLSSASLLKDAVSSVIDMSGDLSAISAFRDTFRYKPEEKSTVLEAAYPDVVDARDNQTAAPIYTEVTDEEFMVIEETKQQLAREIAQVDVLELVLKRMEDMRQAESEDPNPLVYLQSLLTQAVDRQAGAILRLRKEAIKHSLVNLTKKLNQYERSKASWYQVNFLFELAAFSKLEDVSQEVHSRAKPGPFTDAARVRIKTALDLLKKGSVKEVFESDIEGYKSSLLKDITPKWIYDKIGTLVQPVSTTPIFDEIMSQEEVDVIQQELSEIVDRAREEFYSVNIDGMFDKEMPATPNALVEYMFEFDKQAVELKKKLELDTVKYQAMKGMQGKRTSLEKRQEISQLHGEIQSTQDALRKLREKAKLDVMTLVYETYPRASWAADCIIYSHNSIIDDSAFVVKQIFDFATGADLQMPYYDEIKLQVQEGLNATRDHVLQQVKESVVRSAAMAAAGTVLQSAVNNLNDDQTDRSDDRRLGKMKPANTAEQVCSPCDELEQLKKDNQETKAEVKETNKLLKELLNASYFDQFKVWMKVDAYLYAYKMIKLIVAQLASFVEFVRYWGVEIIARYWLAGPYSILALCSAKAAAAVVARTVAFKMCPRARAKAIKELEKDESVHSKMLVEEMQSAFPTIPAAPVSTFKQPITATHIKALHKKSRFALFSAFTRDTMASAYEQVTLKLKHHPFALPLLLAL